MEVVSGAPVSDAARRYGVSGQAVHGWLGRYEREVSIHGLGLMSAPMIA